MEKYSRIIKEYSKRLTNDLGKGYTFTALTRMRKLFMLLEKLATVSQQLTERYGSGYTPTALFRMLKVARIYPDEKTLATLSQQLTWSHLIELITIEQETKRLFYQNMAIKQRWSLRQLRKHED